MGKTIDSFTQDVRKRKWTELLISCNKSGQSKVEWCKEHMKMEKPHQRFMTNKIYGV